MKVGTSQNRFSRLYPNPASDAAMLEFWSDNSGKVSLKIADARGARCWNGIDSQQGHEYGRDIIETTARWGVLCIAAIWRESGSAAIDKGGLKPTEAVNLCHRLNTALYCIKYRELPLLL